MAKRIENPNVDDIGIGGVELNAKEFDTFVGYYEGSGVDVSLLRQAGFYAAIQRSPNTEPLFNWLKMPSDVMIISVCREGSLDAMKAYLQFTFDEQSRKGREPSN